MTNNPKMSESDNCQKNDNKSDGYHQQRNHQLMLMKIKFKSSTNIDEEKQREHHIEKDMLIRSLVTPNHRLLLSKPRNIRTRSKLKKILRFGYNDDEIGERENSESCTLCDLNGNISIPNDSISDLESELNHQNHYSDSSSLLTNNMSKLSQSPSSSITEIMCLPKMMVSNCLEEVNSSKQRVYPNNNSSSSSSKPIRVIKPRAIHPSVMEKYDPPRPSTSVGVYMESLIRNHSSAFHQVHSSNKVKHCRSSSLNETLASSNPYSNPLSMESIETEKENWNSQDEPIHMTLEEVRRIAFGSPERFPSNINSKSPMNIQQNDSLHTTTIVSPFTSRKMATNGLQNAKSKLKNLFDNLLNKTPCIGSSSNDYAATKTDAYNLDTVDGNEENQDPNQQRGNRSPVINHIRDLFWHNYHNQNDSNWLQNLESLEQRHRHHNRRRRRYRHNHRAVDTSNLEFLGSSPFTRRALPPLPPSTAELSTTTNQNNNKAIGLSTLRNDTRRYQSLQRVSRSQFKSMSEYERQKYLDYVSSIERVKNYGWYWGPISGEMAEKLLDPEPCGSFLVRDSSDEHYIFSLSFKLDGMVRHVRIEQEQGNFSFGSLKKFRSSTIVDFIETAMEHSRSGQFLFFLRLGPELGPIRVQLLHPVSRFKRVQSLQHICRFVILQYVRRDQIHELALPECLRYYLDTPYYYSEELAEMQLIQAENHQQERLLEMKRKFFLQTDYQTLLSKMLINRKNIEQKLSIRLTDFPTDLSPSNFSLEQVRENQNQKVEDENLL